MESPVLAGFAAVLQDANPALKLPNLTNTEKPEAERARAYAFVEHAIHTWGPAACRLQGREDLAAELEAVPFDDGPAGEDGTRDNPGAAHRAAWPALGLAEYKLKTFESWQSGERTTIRGRTQSASDSERWTLWARRCATWAVRADDFAGAVAALTAAKSR